MQVHNKIGAFSFDTPLSVCGQSQETVALCFAFLPKGGKGTVLPQAKWWMRCSSSPVKLPVSVRPLFSLTPQAQRKKFAKKKRRKRFRALRSATKDAVFGNCDLLKKVDQNFAPDNAWSKTNAVEDQCGRRPLRSKTMQKTNACPSASVVRL